MSRAIDTVSHCNSMMEVRQRIDALDDILVPLLVERSSYMLQAARIKQDVSQVRDEDRIEAIVARVREKTLSEGGDAGVMEAIYRNLMEACIAYEHCEFVRLREEAGASPRRAAPSGLSPFGGQQPVQRRSVGAAAS